jgi:hypothetical protein
VNVKAIIAGAWLDQCAFLARGCSIALLILLISAAYWRVTAGPSNMPSIISFTGEHPRRRHGLWGAKTRPWALSWSFSSSLVLAVIAAEERPVLAAVARSE